MKKLSYVFYLMLVAFLFTSCGDWDDDGIDFRNYLRDKHPYSELKQVKLYGLFSYQVNDTINNEVWIYSTNRSESSVRSVCVNCN